MSVELEVQPLALRAYTTLRRLQLACRPKDVRKRKGTLMPGVDEQAHVMALRRKENAETWRAFKARGLDQAWRFVNNEEPVCPSLDLHPAVFRDRLKMGAVPINWQRPGEAYECELHRLLARKLRDRVTRLANGQLAE